MRSIDLKLAPKTAEVGDQHNPWVLITRADNGMLPPVAAVVCFMRGLHMDENIVSMVGPLTTDEVRLMWGEFLAWSSDIELAGYGGVHDPSDLPDDFPGCLGDF